MGSLTLLCNLFLGPFTPKLSILTPNQRIIKGHPKTSLEDFFRNKHCIRSHLEYSFIFFRILFLVFYYVLSLELLLKTTWKLSSSATCCPIPRSGFYRTILYLYEKTLNFVTSHIVMSYDNVFNTWKWTKRSCKSNVSHLYNIWQVVCKDCHWTSDRSMDSYNCLNWQVTILWWRLHLWDTILLLFGK